MEKLLLCRNFVGGECFTNKCNFNHLRQEVSNPWLGGHFCTANPQHKRPAENVNNVDDDITNKETVLGMGRKYTVCVVVDKFAFPFAIETPVWGSFQGSVWFWEIK